MFAKRDWLIYDHVASDKCNVSRRATSKKLLPAASKTNFKSYMEPATKKQRFSNLFQLVKITRIFQVLFSLDSQCFPRLRLGKH